MKVLIIGSGGRENAICWKLSQDKNISKIYCLSGNGGISKLAECINIDVLDFNEIIKFVNEKNIDITIVGTELPLSLGIVNEFQKHNLKIFGPTKKASQIESSKIFAKNFMKKYNIPTAKYHTFYDYNDAIKYINTTGNQLVIKADGLSMGKGVFIPFSKTDALMAVQTLMNDQKFGEAGSKIVIEEKLDGYELSLLLFVSNSDFIPLLYAKDHKRIFDDDKGSNTGGMGAIAPVHICYTLNKKILNKIVIPTVNAMEKEQLNYHGILFIGLMIQNNEPFVLEYNCRMGDPEIQSILPLMKNNLIDVIEAVINNKLSEIKLEWENKYATCVVLSSKGYPDKYEIGKEITGLENIKDSYVFHSGTILKDDKYYTNGGRVLSVTSFGKDREESIKNVYNEIQKINFEGMYYRKDIGKCVN